MIDFKPITIEAAQEILQYTKITNNRSCDYTLGCLIMWSEFMHYEYAIEDRTLYISAISQHDLLSPAFLPPIGKNSLTISMDLLKRYCNKTRRELRLTAVPEEYTKELDNILPDYQRSELNGWSDYIYRANSLATLQGHTLNKKRNRFNKFCSTYPQYQYERYNNTVKQSIIDFLISGENPTTDNAMKKFEQEKISTMIHNFDKFPQLGAAIWLEGKIIAFTMGEIINDTLYIHIEKASHEIIGASETINKLFASDILNQYPELQYINREEDLGETGLKQAKLSYQPIYMLNRFEYTRQIR